MSSVTDMFVIVGDTEDARADVIAPEVADAISTFVFNVPGGVPVISLERADWRSLQSGKIAGSAVIWFGWNHAHPESLEEHLKVTGFRNITVWSHHEFHGLDGVPPRVVSW